MSKKETLPVTEEKQSGEGKKGHGHDHGKKYGGGMRPAWYSPVPGCNVPKVGLLLLMFLFHAPDGLSRLPPVVAFFQTKEDEMFSRMHADESRSAWRFSL